MALPKRPSEAAALWFELPRQLVRLTVQYDLGFDMRRR